MFKLPIQTERLSLRGQPSAVTIEHGGEVVGELGVVPTHEATQVQLTIEIVPTAQRQRFAGEAVDAMVSALFAEGGINRIVALVDDLNIPAMAVIEPLGFRFEGIARQVALVDGEWVDRAQFALVRADRELWLARSRTRPERIEFVELNDDNSYLYARLATHRFQQQFVAPMHLSFRDALLPEVINGEPAVPWFRGVAADGEPVGFVMVAEVTKALPVPYLWRLLVDRAHQRRGIGKRIMAMLIDDVRRQGQSRLDTSWSEGPGGPAPFYRSLGFVPTGNLIDDEIEAVLNLS